MGQTHLGIMQPYFFPYIGYFQLVAAVDSFVFYDDVNYIKNGWVNRNQIAVNGAPQYITVPLKGASPFSPINRTAIQEGDAWRQKMLEKVRHAYVKAPYFPEVFQLFGDTLSTAEASIGALAGRSVVAVSAYLGLAPRFVMSSADYGNEALHGQTRIIDICRREKCDVYWNLPGGKDLYDAGAFGDAGVRLQFIQPNLAPYRQSQPEFLPGLSILDVLMFNAPEKVRKMLVAEHA